MAAMISRTRVLPQFARIRNFNLNLNSIRTVTTQRFTKSHEYVKYDTDTNIGTIGITNYAQNSLGDVVFVELPSVGSVIKQAEQIGAVESVKAASDIYAPVEGEVTEVNEELNDRPNLLNKSPEDEGWLCSLRLSKPEEFDNLLNEEAYKSFCESVSDE